MIFQDFEHLAHQSLLIQIVELQRCIHSINDCVFMHELGKLAKNLLHQIGVKNITMIFYVLAGHQFSFIVQTFMHFNVFAVHFDGMQRVTILLGSIRRQNMLMDMLNGLGET